MKKNLNIFLISSSILILLIGIYLINGLGTICDDITGDCQPIKEVGIGIIFILISIILFYMPFRNFILDKYRELKQLKVDIEKNKQFLLKLREEIENTESIKKNMTSEIKRLSLEIDSFKQQIDKNSIEHIDNLNSLEFEEYIVHLLKINNYIKVKKIKPIDDYGIDILAEKDEIKYAIQCKNYNSTVGNTSIQKVYNGKIYYKCHVGIVVTNNYFTPNAKELAVDNGIILWDRDKLIEMIKQKKGNKEKTISNQKNQLNYSYNTSELSEDYDYDDPLYNEILEFAMKVGKISASLIQRKFYLGYNRSARIIDLLEKRGIIGPQNGSKPREVIIKKD